MIPKYKRLIVVNPIVEAVQYNDDVLTIHVLTEMLQDNFRKHSGGHQVRRSGVWLYLTPSDYIVKDSDGHIIIKDDYIFEKEYMLV